MPVPRDMISSLFQAKEYADAAAAASRGRCPSVTARYMTVASNAAQSLAQNLANTPFEGDAVRRLVDDLRAIDGRCDDVAKYGVNAPDRMVKGNEPAPMPVTAPPAGTQPFVPKNPPSGTTSRTPTAVPTATAGGSGWLWGLFAFAGVVLLKKGKKGKRTTRKRTTRRRSTRRRRRR